MISILFYSFLFISGGIIGFLLGFRFYEILLITPLSYENDES